jgi:hypothetical protein
LFSRFLRARSSRDADTSESSTHHIEAAAFPPPRRSVLGTAALISLALGIAIGLLVTWVLLPVQYTNADAADLRLSYKDDYLRMIGAAYQVDGNLNAAKARLNELGLSSPIQSIDNLIARDRAASVSPTTLEALTMLAQSISVKPDLVAARPTSAPQAVVVVTTPTAVVPTFKLVEHTQLSCVDEPDAAYLRFIVRDVHGHDLPNVGIQIRWSGGDDTVYTGLMPERGVGYADYEATPGNYTVTILNAQSDTVSDLIVSAAPADCKTDHGATPRGWKLVFQQQ